MNASAAGLAGGEALQLFSDDLLEHVPVQREISDQSLELRVLLTQTA